MVNTYDYHYDCNVGGNPVSIPFTSTLSLFQLKSDGSNSLTPLHRISLDLVPFDAPCINTICDNPWAWPWQVIPDGSGGTLVSWTDHSQSPPLVYVTHVSSSGQSDYPFPALYHYGTPMVLGENGAAYVTDSQTIQAFDFNSGQSLWSYTSQAYGFDIIASTANGGLAAKEFNTDNTETVVRFDSTGAATRDPWSGSDIDYWAGSRWLGLLNNTLDAFAGQSTDVALSAWPEPEGDAQKQNASPKLNVATFIARAPGYPGQPLFGTPTSAQGYLNSNISSKAANNKFYVGLGKPAATVANFLTVIGDAYQVVGFIGDSDVISCAGVINNANCPFSNGLVFAGTYLIRTPNCTNISLGYCYNLDTVDYPVSAATYCPNGTGLAGYISVPANGGCYKYSPPCAPTAVLIGNYCFVFLPGINGQPPVLKDSLSPNAKVVFIGACQVTNVFTDWWNLNLSQNGAGALVVPDLTAMANAPQNAGNPNMGSVDLAQATVGYQAFVNALSTGSNVGDAITAANTAISNWYSPNNYTSINEPVLPMVIYKPVGNAGLCLRSCPK
jgi:hypothetical protein